MKQHKYFHTVVRDNRPLQNVNITDENRARGFITVGSATIDKADKKQFINRKGYFLQKYELSDEYAGPIFSKNNITELEKIVIE